MGKVRIIGGKHRSRILNFNDKVVGLRPTLDRIRETVFNWLGQDLTGKKCLDLFAGSGSLGFEALSRGAVHVTFVENDKNAIWDLRRNQELLNITNLNIIGRNALSFLQINKSQFEVIFLDPPYTSDLLQQSLDFIKNTEILSLNGVVYIEYHVMPNIDGYTLVKESKAGAVVYALLQSARINS